MLLLKLPRFKSGAAVISPEKRVFRLGRRGRPLSRPPERLPFSTASRSNLSPSPSNVFQRRIDRNSRTYPPKPSNKWRRNSILRLSCRQEHSSLNREFVHPLCRKYCRASNRNRPCSWVWIYWRRSSPSFPKKTYWARDVPHLRLCTGACLYNSEIADDSNCNSSSSPRNFAYCMPGLWRAWPRPVSRKPRPA